MHLGQAIFSPPSTMMVRAMVASEKSGSEPETRKKRKSGSDPMVREVVAHSVSLPDCAEVWLFENLEGGATVEQFLGWFPGVARAQRASSLNAPRRAPSLAR